VGFGFIISSKHEVLIAYLNGKLTLKTATHVYVDCNGVGYHVNIRDTLRIYG